MRAVIQRVLNGNVVINNEKIAEIGNGFVILLGIENGDDREKVKRLALKIANLRIFGDNKGKMNLSLLDVKGSAIVVSQFTLMADTRKGNRPSFTSAASPEIAIPLVDFFAEKLSQIGIPTQKGNFGAHMQVSLTNDGPVTIELQE
jgi:D-tyrosyl-tRNA(Tyr) deacylase